MSLFKMINCFTALFEIQKILSGICMLQAENFSWPVTFFP